MSSRPARALAAVCLTLTPVVAAAAQSFAVSPFVSYIPSSTTNPLAGFALTFGGTSGLALRSGAEMSISNPRLDSAAAATQGGIRPWGADADAMLFLGGLGGGGAAFGRGLSPYVFAGIGLAGADSAGRNLVGHNWSYGAGATIPLGFNASIFGEARWRMAEYVLPTSQGAPDSKSSMRFGLSFHVGGGGNAGRPRRNRMADADEEDVYVVNPAPAQQPVVVVAPAQQEPQVIVLEQEAAPEPVIIESAPVQETPAPIWRTNPSSRTPTTVTSPSRRSVLGMPGRTRGTARVLDRRSARVRTQRVPAAGGAAVIGRAGGSVARRGTSSAGSVGSGTRTLPKAQGRTTRALPNTQARAQTRVRTQAQVRTKSPVVPSKIKRSAVRRSSGEPK
jgi:hypothetical protein